ncbi:MAG TPA: site-specific DNA-methyltransferase [Candidatus Krumholzibacteria bacterium]|nr:site-specific DNA-methyltransferase [Candidatus Krumholzibacteria bacterium]
MSKEFEKLQTLLKELFQLDQPDLDFGFYRVMHAKNAEVSQFLEHDLLPQVKDAFALYKTADRAEMEKELAKVVAGIEAAGMDPEQSPKVAELRERLEGEAVDVDQLAREVYDHLFSFFRRYYSEGDFLSKRVYKPGVYAIPYEGEEVKLYWANADQYYIKTSEYLRDYAFRLRPNDAESPMRVHFRLVDAAEGEHGNVKAAAGKDRVFILAAPGESGHGFIAEDDGEQGKELVVRFEYRPATMGDWPKDKRAQEEERLKNPKPPTQKDLNALATESVLALEDPSFAPWIAALAKPQRLASGEEADYSTLRAHLNRYTARNTFDHFIHKDLGGFLRRELDFYIKNEVMHLDDIENESAPRVEQYLSKIKVIRRIAGKIIEFLAQLEDFQKKLWLKKKFIVETQWCIRLGVIPEEFYAEIAANEAQREEWVNLYAIDEVKGDLVTPAYSKKLKPEFLKAHPTLMVDTKYFAADFTAQLLERIGEIDEQMDGLLLQSENLQALRNLRRLLDQGVQCILLDPPYNTGNDGFAFKDHYQRSSWIAMMAERLSASKRLLRLEGAAFVHIDDTEYRDLWHVLAYSLGQENYLGSLVWKRRSASAMSDRALSLDHEYVLAFGKSSDHTILHGLQRSEANFPLVDAKTGRRYASDNLTIGMTREQRPNQFYSITNPRTGIVFPANPNRVWRFAPETMQQVIDQDLVIWPDEYEGNLERPRYKTFFDPENMKPKPCSSWIETAGVNDREIEEEETEYLTEILQCGMNAEGSREIGRIFGRKAFAYPKPVSLVRSLVRISTRQRDRVLDFFAGSGTTGHATISMNREDGGGRIFILIDIDECFDSVLLPRLKKITFSPEWKDGKPKRLPTPEEAERSPRIVKVVRLESYEDALNNLETRRTKEQQDLLDLAQAQGADGLKEQYVLRYMLDVETRGSQSLLNIQSFTDPTAYTLKVKRPGSEESHEVNVDLLETFNWLIGLTVKHIAAPRTFSATFERDSEGRLHLSGRLKQDASADEEGAYWFRTVTGTTPDGRRTLVIWRKRPGGESAEGVEQDNLILSEWFTEQGYSSKDSEFDLIYVNGGNNLENLKTPDDLWRVRLIEEHFHRLMFETEGA